MINEKDNQKLKNFIKIKFFLKKLKNFLLNCCKFVRNLFKKENFPRH